MNKKCQVFTPNDYVKKLLDSVGYNKNIYGKNILENSCGDGNILAIIVERYIEDARRQGISERNIKSGLAENICGVEIDPTNYAKCIQRLNNLAREKGIKKVKWNIFNADYLSWESKRRFHYVVGNPPYITYQDLNEKTREYVRDNFITCKKGKFDYCYAFIEKSVDCLTDNGKMAYLIPSSIFKTVFGERLRAYIQTYLRIIYDYTQDNMFNDALVKSAIMVLDKTSHNKKVIYYDMASKDKIVLSEVEFSNKWVFAAVDRIGNRRFGDYFKVANVVATLFNEAFVLKEGSYKEVEGFFHCNGRCIEKKIIRDTATPRSLTYNKQEKIIFPYDYMNGTLIRYNSKQFSELFPGAEKYLNDFREQLDARKKDKNALWFEYGRSQALAGLNRQKLLISRVVTNEIKVYILDKECIPYAGMYIVPKINDKLYDLEFAKKILESDIFMKYVQKVGVHISGASLRITSKDIEEYTF